MKIVGKVLGGLFLVAMISLCSCSSVPRAMSGKIGCPHDEIQILETNSGLGVVNTTWTAQCRGQKFVCSLRPGAEDINDLDDMNCSAIRSRHASKGKSQNFDEFVEGLNKKSQN